MRVTRTALSAVPNDASDAASTPETASDTRDISDAITAEKLVNDPSYVDTDPRQYAQQAAQQALEAQLSQPLDPALLKQREGYGKEKDGSQKMLDYLEWHTVTRQLNRFFGPGNWSWEVKSIQTYGEDPQSGVPRVVTATAMLTVNWPNGEITVYTNNGLEVVKGKEVWENGKRTGRFIYTWEAFEMAYKGAAHDAFKRAATALGDQFGLSLYAKEEETKAARTSAVVEASATTASAAATTSTSSPASSSASSPASSSASGDYDPDADEVAACENCEREIRGYTHKTTGKVYTTKDLVDISKRQTGGRVLCYSCRTKNR